MTIEEIQKQIVELQRIVESMQIQKLEVSRHFTGDYFKPYRGKQYRRMESENIPIWEHFCDKSGEWTVVSSDEVELLEDTYCSECVTPVKKS